MARMPTTPDPRYAMDGPAILPPSPGAFLPASRRGSPTLPGNLGGVGPAPGGASDPNMLSTADTSDELSPTTIVLNYLKSKGMQPNAENIRRTIEANARDPGALGPNLVGYNNAAGRDIELRNAAPENSAPAPSGGSAGGRPLPVPLISQQTALPPPPGQSGTPQYIPMPDAGGPPIGMPPPPTSFPPVNLSPVGGQPAPMMPPPPAGAAAVPPVPQPPRAASPALPMLPPPPPQLALPAPAQAGQLALPAPPTAPQIAAPPELPALPAPRAPLALPAPTPELGGIPNTAPQDERGGQVRIGNVQPKIAPGPRIQGAPIEPGPVMGPLGRSAVGGISGFRRGGIPGAIVGAAPGAIDLGRYIAKNLHLF